MLVFAHIEKTAGKTMRSLLRRHFGPRQCDLYNGPGVLRERDWGFIRRHYPRLECMVGHACMPETFIGRRPGVRMFTFLRDPIARAASAYQYGHHRGRDMLDFEEWARRTANFQTRALTRRKHPQADADEAIQILEERVGFVGLVESFDESLILFKHWLGDPSFDLSYRGVNVAPDNRMKKGILADDAKRELLVELNAEDRRLYDHVRDTRLPAARAAFGDGLDAALAALTESHKTARPASASLHAVIGQAKRNFLFRPRWNRRIRGRENFTTIDDEAAGQRLPEDYGPPVASSAA
ncbi:MAG: hypothetical protein AAFX76_06430 [Planctomycetota bacterium]